IAYDTGPGNMIIDAFVFKHSEGTQSYDLNGDLASSGVVHEEWLDEMMRHEYFSYPAPKVQGENYLELHTRTPCGHKVMITVCRL
ncbi:anhydro-N-acetylmuramic acid kinase, partial [Leptospira santarosai]|nr:anhydro-N-acetylmuramic acid kinase [Leptospira santarosai]